jgi:rRNA biogenesis protein RRP5
VEEGDDVVPESVDEFDRLVLASPDSSLCWIQYIAFHMEKQEFGLAREVIKRALEKINFRYAVSKLL